jgi:hypothetical protein
MGASWWCSAASIAMAAAAGVGGRKGKKEAASWRSYVGAIVGHTPCKFSIVHIYYSKGIENTNTRPLLNNSAKSWQLASNQSIRRHSKQRNPHSVSISTF